MSGESTAAVETGKTKDVVTYHHPRCKRCPGNPRMLIVSTLGRVRWAKCPQCGNRALAVEVKR